MGAGASRKDCWDEGGAAPGGGTWEKFSNVDMCMQGDVKIIGRWKSKHSIAEMKRIVEQNNWSAITVSSGTPSFDHAALKNFDYQLRRHHLAPITTCCNHPCTIFVYTPPHGRAKPEGGPRPKLVLVSTSDPKRLTLMHAQKIRAGGAAPLTLASHPGYAIVRQFAERREAFGEWYYTALAIGPAEEAITCMMVDGGLGEVDTKGVVTPAFLKVDDGNHFDLVWHMRNHPARLHSEARKHKSARPLAYEIAADGGVASAARPYLSLGLEKQELPALMTHLPRASGTFTTVAPTYAQMPVARPAPPMAAPSMTMVQVVVPAGVGAGQPFQVSSGGTTYAVTCPPGAHAGQTIALQLPAPQSAPPIAAATVVVEGFAVG